MHMLQLFRRALACLLLCLLPGAAWAVATSGASSSIVFPVVAKTSSFETEIFVLNRSSVAIEVDVLYYEANGLAFPGLKTCTFLSLAGGETRSFKISTQCTDPVLATGSHFGLLVLRDRAAEKVNTFYAFARVQHVSTLQGFSIEGFPEHTFSGALATVTGLKRTGPAGAYGTYLYQANCFVGSLGDAVNYRIQLYDSTGTQIGNNVDGSLGPYQLVRYVDIFSVAGLPNTEFTNVRVNFNDTDDTPSSVEPGFVAFCTQQDNQSFGADFRIAKSIDAGSLVQRKVRCRGANSDCSDIGSPAAYSIPNASTMQRWSLFIHHPDYLKCSILGPNAAKLEMRIIAPTGGPPKGGGNDVGPLYFYTGPRQAAYDDGTQSFWSLDVSPRESVAQTFPIEYGMRCESGSGIHVGGTPTALTDEF